MKLRSGRPWDCVHASMEAFVLLMLQMGRPVGVALVGAFDEGDSGLGSRRDMDLVPHRDGVYSAALAESQDGQFLSNPNVDVVGLYCIRSGPSDCQTTFHAEDGAEIGSVRLRAGQALVFNNRKVLHGRRGPVGDRLLLRIWIETPRPLEAAILEGG